MCVFSPRALCCLMGEKGKQNVWLPPVVSPRVAEQGARIWEVLRGIILTLRLGDIAGFSSSHNSGALLSSMYTVRFNNAEREDRKQRLRCML